jgi:hypothetical protein
MGNERFNDVGILNTLARLQRSGMLNDGDRQELVEMLSPWGKQQAERILSSNRGNETPLRQATA